MRVIGMMSGTSYDAIDAAVADLSFTDDGATVELVPLGALSRPYPPALRAAIEAALPPAATDMAAVCRLDTGIGQAFAALAADAVDQLCEGAADLVVSHGQTLYHWVEDGQVRGSLQLGQPAWIAERTGLPVVADLRSRDIAAGGQGAPLVSLFDALWLHGRPGRPVALNLGGIANVTALGDGPPVAFDTGPANALIDAATAHGTGGRLAYDVDGELAGRGRIDDSLLRRLLAEPYYALPAPKTTGKELFHLPYLLDALRGSPGLPPEDVVATLTALTARTVADAVVRCGGTEVVAAGGGTRNPVLMRALAEALDPVPLSTSADHGVPVTAKEALAFALLGFLTVHGVSGTVAEATGARHARVLGTVVPGRTPPRLTPPQQPPMRLHIAEQTWTSGTLVR